MTRKGWNIGVLLWAAMAAAPCFGAEKTVPDVQGLPVAVDPYVKEYQETMTSVEAEMVAIKADIHALPAPVGKAAAAATRDRIDSLYAPMAGLMRKAEEAQMKMLKHILGAEGSMDLDFDRMLGLPPADGNGGAPQAKPQEESDTQGSPQAPAAAKPALEQVPSQYSGLQVGTGFDEGLADPGKSAPAASPNAPAAGRPAAAPSPDDAEIDAIRERMLAREQASARALANRDGGADQAQ